MQQKKEKQEYIKKSTSTISHPVFKIQPLAAYM